VRGGKSFSDVLWPQSCSESHWQRHAPVDDRSSVMSVSAHLLARDAHQNKRAMIERCVLS
jgi:hypothetical protein